MSEIYGIRWILVNNWEGKAFSTRTFGANLPTGVLFRTVDRFEGIMAPADDAIRVSLVFVPDVRIIGDDAPSGEWPAIEEVSREDQFELDPRFLRPELGSDEAPDLLDEPEPIGFPEITPEQIAAGIFADDQAPDGGFLVYPEHASDIETAMDAAAGHFLDPPSKHSVGESIRIWFRNLGNRRRRPSEFRQ